MQDEKYSINEIIGFAIQIEKEGIFFYQKVSDKTKSKILKDLYTLLKEDELAHKKQFETFLNNLSKPEDYSYNLENEDIRYLHTVIENIIFNDEQIDELVNLLTDEVSVLEYAICKEEDSIDFYRRMKLLLSKDESDMIDKIIKIEEKHLKILTEHKENISNIS
jgi:rubrerythrin